MILNLATLNDKYRCTFTGVLHIGAHYGEEYPTYKNLNINSIVFVEAVPSTYQVLRQNVGPECICINAAMGSQEGTTTMHISEASPCSSVLKPKLHLEQYPDIVFKREELVRMTTVDSLSIPRLNFLNLDVQGYELEVLKGAKNYLEGVDYIMTEVNRAEVYENCAKVDELDNYLAPYGFARVETDWAGNTWGDAFYIRIYKSLNETT